MALNDTILCCCAIDAVLKSSAKAKKVKNLFICLQILIYNIKFYSKIIAIIIAAVSKVAAHFFRH